MASQEHEGPGGESAEPQSQTSAVNDELHTAAGSHCKPRSPLTQTRLDLLARGYAPTPVKGKRALMKGWPKKTDPTAAEVEAWELSYPHCQSTGVLCRKTPVLDADLLNPEAADEAERIVRERFGGRGVVLSRTGRAPKRAFFFRTDAPFDKVEVNFRGGEKIEFLADGQMAVVYGTHPDTKQPYTCRDKPLWEVDQRDLPLVTEAEVREVVSVIAATLVREHGYEVGKDDGPDPGGADDRSADWDELLDNVQSGGNFHDSVNALAMKLLLAGMSDPAVVNFLRALMQNTEAPHDERWQARYDDVPRSVSTARKKIAGEHQPSVIRWHGEIDPVESRPWLVQDLFPEVGKGLISGQWGTYKTFVALDLALSVMTGTPFLGFDVVRKGGVLFLALEGQNEVAIRLQGAINAKVAGTLERAPFAWVETCPPLLAASAADELSATARQVAAKLDSGFGLPLALVVVDTMTIASGHAKDGADNDATVTNLVMTALSKVAASAGCFVVGIDHFGKDVSVGTRGSSVKEGNADTVLALLGERTVGGTVTNARLALRKRRSGPNGLEFPFRPRAVSVGTDQRGVTVSTLVIDWGGADEPPRRADPDWGRGRGDKDLRQVIASLVSSGVEIRPRSDGPPVIAVEVRRVRDEFYRVHLATGDGSPAAQRRAKRVAFGRAIDTAIGRGVIETREVNNEDYLWLSRRGTDGT